MKRALFCFSIVSFMIVSGITCNVPVFRYALERWQPDPYIITIYYNTTLTADQLELANMIQKQSIEGEAKANYLTQWIDLTERTDLPENQLPPEVPGMDLRFPIKTGITAPIVSGPLTEEFYHRLIDSPVRAEIAKRLCSGESAVWLLLESGDDVKNNELAAIIEQRLKHLAETLQLPDQSKTPNYDPAAGSSDWIDLSSLKIDFSFIRLPRGQSDESIWIHQLLHSEIDLIHYPNEPMLFPIFGRGRILYAMIGAGIHERNLNEAAQFLVGPCSCIVKDDNPGFDALLTANWEEAIENPLVVDELVALPFGLTRESQSPPDTSTTAMDSNMESPSDTDSSAAMDRTVRTVIAAFILLAIAQLAFFAFFYWKNRESI